MNFGLSEFLEPKRWRAAPVAAGKAQSKARGRQRGDDLNWYEAISLAVGVAQLLAALAVINAK